jgi:cephalosporin-C deacetylase
MTKESPTMRHDIESFWQETLREADRIPLQAELSPAPAKSTPFVTTHGVRLTSWENVKVRAWFSVPNLGRARYPALLTVPGYGGEMDIPTELVVRGFAVLTLFPRGQGESRQEWQMDSPTQLLHHPLDRSKFYYRGAYVDCMRAVNFLITHPEVDIERIGMLGTSQGGGLTLATCALDRRIRAACAHIPFLCNYPVATKTATTGPFEHVQKYVRENPSSAPQYLDTLTYFDPVNLAPAITCPILMSVGLKDTTCPSQTIIPVFDAIRCKKSLAVFPDLTHAHSLEFRQMEMEWLLRHLVM